MSSCITDLPLVSVIGDPLSLSHCSEVTRILSPVVDISSQVSTIELPSGLVKRS